MCQVYIIEQAETGYIKIGISEDVQKRLAALQTANPHKLTLRYILTCPTTQDAQTIERMLHQRYSDWRKSGEWFDVDAEEAISEIQWCMQFASHVTGGTEFHIEVVQEVVTVRKEIKPFGGAVWLRRLFETKRLLSGALKAVDKIAVPSKEELAREWFHDHPDDKSKTGRELQDMCLPQGVRISYVTWNKVKKQG